MRLSVLFLVGMTATASAESHFMDAAREALSDAQMFTDFSRESADATLSIAIETDQPMTTMDEPALQEAGALATSTATTEAGAYGTFQDNIVEWSVQSADPSALALADGAVDDPLAYMTENPFSTVGGACTVTDFSSAPVFERSCERNLESYASSCTSVLNLSVVRIEDYVCASIGDGDSCDELAASALCTETARVCQLQDIDGNCIDEDVTYTCSSDEPMSFVAAQLGETRYAEPVSFWTTSCAADYTPSSCVELSSGCTSGASVEDVNGLLVPVECTAQETTYECASSSYSGGDCSIFESDASCEVIDSFCFLELEDGTCGSYEDTYRCGSEENTDFSTSCEDVNVCVHGVCQAIPQDTNSDLPEAMAAISMLNDMAAEWDAEAGVWPFYELVDVELQYFSADTEKCRKAALNAYNCCRDSGWAVGIFTDCKESELLLAAAQEAGRTVYLETYCSAKALFFCLEKSKRYCVYGGRIAKEVSRQGQLQLYGEFECRAITHEEMELIDWSAIDLTAVFGDMLAEVDLPDQSELISVIESNTGALAPQVESVYE